MAVQTVQTETRKPESPLVVPGVRVAVDDLAPKVSKAMATLEGASRKTSLEPSLQELVRLRASQLNGCVYCVDLHSRDAVAGGDDQRKVNAVSVWREAPFFTARERAALALTEAGTELTAGPVDDALLAQARAHFTEEELAELIWVIAVINAWNRLGALARPWPLG